jgi:tape measure domain-containing protein
MKVGQIIATLGVDPKEYEKGLKKAEAQADKAGSKIGSIFKNAFSVTLGVGMFDALKKGFKSTVGTAISFNSMLQTAQIGFATMLGSAEKAQKFLDEMADFASKTPFEYPDLLEASKRMLAYGFSAEEILPTLRAVGDATAALGMGGEGIDRVVLALGQIRAKGKLSGEEMRQLTEAGIPAWNMLADAMGKTVPELQDMVSKGLIPGAKAVEILTKGMTKRFGGMMASMEDTWQGVTSSIKDIWRMTVGTLTQNLFGGLNTMLIHVRDYLSAFYTLIQKTMGKKAIQATDGLVDSTKSQADALSAVGDAAEEAAKKSKKTTQSFDEFHELQKDTTGVSALGAIGAIGTESPIDSLMPEETEESDKLTRMQEFLEKLKVLFEPAIEGFNRLKVAAEPVITSIGDGLRWFYDNVLVPFGTWVIAEAVPSFMDLLSGAFNILNPILEAFKPLGQWLWESFLQPAGEWAGEALLDALEWLADALTRIGDWMSEHKGVIEAIAIVVGSFAAAWGLVNLAIGIWNVIGAIAAGVTTAFGAAVAFLTSPIFLIVAVIAAVIAIVVLLIKHWDEVKAAAIACWEWIKETWAVVAEWFDTNIIQPLVNFFTDLWDGIKQLASDAWNGIVEIWQTVSEWFDTNVIQPVAKFFAGLWDGIKEAASNAWDGIVEAWNGATSWIDTNIIQPIAQFFTDLWEGIKEVWNKATGWFDKNVIQPIIEVFEDLKKGIDDIWDGIWGGIKSVVNSIIGGINTLIRGLNKLHFDIPDWVPVIGGKSFGINIPEIPKLEVGTNYVPKDMMAYLHEGEAVVPKKYNPAASGDGFVGNLAREMKNAFLEAMLQKEIAAGGSDGKEIRITMVLENGEVLADMMVDPMNRIAKNRGYAPVFKPAT